MISVNDARRITQDVINKKCDEIADAELDGILSDIDRAITSAASQGLGSTEIIVRHSNGNMFFWIKLARKLQSLGYKVRFNECCLDRETFVEKKVEVSLFKARIWHETFLKQIFCIDLERLRCNVAGIEILCTCDKNLSIMRNASVGDDNVGIR